MNGWVRRLVIGPLAGASALVWVFMLSAWMGYGGMQEKEVHEKALKQTMAQEAEPPKPEPQQPPEPVKQEQAAAAQPAPSATLSAAREDLEKRGLEFFAAGKGLDDLPSIDGAAASLEDYIAFSRDAGWHFMVYSVGQKRWLGELRPGDRPQLVASDGQFGGGFSKKGRLIEHKRLLDMAREAAEGQGEREVRLYALIPTEWNAYLAGKLLAAMRTCGVSRKEVAVFEARFEVRGGRPTAVFTRAVLSNGKEIAIHDAEG
jgi:hypothetical protein